MPKGRPFKKGQSGNPKGAPKRGESWAELVRSMGDMEPAAIGDFCAAIGRRLPKVTGLTLKQLAVLAAYVDAILDPGPGMFAALADRAEGKPDANVNIGLASREWIDLRGRLVEVLGEYPEARAAILRELRRNDDEAEGTD
jgi:hypothetical protein